MVKYLALMGALLGTLAFVDLAEARHGRGGCAGGSCYSGGYYGGYGYYGGGCPGGVCGVQYAPSYPVYRAAPAKAAVTYSAPAVVTAPAARPVVAPTVAQPAPRYYYYTNTGRWGWRR
jgi:hypothetical protein